MSERRVVCAAIRAADGEVLLGIRHYSRDMHRQIEARKDGEKFLHRHDEDQGFVDQRGIFRGGAILPGFRLMAQSLNQFTAQLPVINEWMTVSEPPGRDTAAAICVGIQYAIGGGIDRIIDSYRRQEPTLRVFLTGGDASRVSLNTLAEDAGPYLALDGLRLVALKNHV